MSKEITTKAGFANALQKITALNDISRRLKDNLDAIKLELDGLMYEAKAYALENNSVFNDKIQKKTSIGHTAESVFKLATDWTFERTEKNRKTGEPKRMDDQAWLTALLESEKTSGYVRIKKELDKQKLRSDVSKGAIKEAALNELFALGKTDTANLTVYRLTDTSQVEALIAEAEELIAKEAE